eukprot:Clim_evm11s157 gene=Clim_evmTU11s157
MGGSVSSILDSPRAETSWLSEENTTLRGSLGHPQRRSSEGIGSSVNGGTGGHRPSWDNHEYIGERRDDHEGDSTLAPQRPQSFISLVVQPPSEMDDEDMFHHHVNDGEESQDGHYSDDMDVEPVHAVSSVNVAMPMAHSQILNAATGFSYRSASDVDDYSVGHVAYRPDNIFSPSETPADTPRYADAAAEGVDSKATTVTPRSLHCTLARATSTEGVAVTRDTPRQQTQCTSSTNDRNRSSGRGHRRSHSRGQTQLSRNHHRRFRFENDERSSPVSPAERPTWAATGSSSSSSPPSSSSSSASSSASPSSPSSSLSAGASSTVAVPSTPAHIEASTSLTSPQEAVWQGPSALQVPSLAPSLRTKQQQRTKAHPRPETQWRLCKTAGPAPTVRSGHVCATDENYLYVFGGYHEGRCNADLYRLHMPSLEWEKLPSAGEIPANTASHSAVLAGNGRHLVIFGGSGVPFGLCNSNATYSYDLLEKRWTLHHIITEDGLNAHGGHGANNLQGQGLAGNADATGGDQPNNTPPSVRRIAPIVPCARYGQSMVQGPDGAVYVFGGTSGLAFFDDLWRGKLTFSSDYVDGSDRDDEDGPRNDSGSGELVLEAGSNGLLRYTDRGTLRHQRVATIEWERVDRIDLGTGPGTIRGLHDRPSARYKHEAVVTDEYMYVFGGGCPGPIDEDAPPVLPGLQGQDQQQQQQRQQQQRPREEEPQQSDADGQHRRRQEQIVNGSLPDNIASQHALPESSSSASQDGHRLHQNQRAQFQQEVKRLMAQGEACNFRDCQASNRRHVLVPATSEMMAGGIGVWRFHFSRREWERVRPNVCVSRSVLRPIITEAGRNGLDSIQFHSAYAGGGEVRLTLGRPGMPSARRSHICVRYQDHIYLHGGTDGGSIRGDLWRFDLATHSWHMMHTDAQPAYHNGVNPACAAGGALQSMLDTVHQQQAQHQPQQEHQSGGLMNQRPSAYHSGTHSPPPQSRATACLLYLSHYCIS